MIITHISTCGNRTILSTYHCSFDKQIVILNYCKFSENMCLYLDPDCVRVLTTVKI